MSFIFPSLFYFWILPLVALPILIHLINLLRHRRVKWAAMEFLLESKKKHQNWVRLKQLLLLLLRMAAIAAIVFMMAGPLLKDKWSALFGGGRTHHVVLLDDSGSMTDRWSGSSAFDRGRDVLSGLVARAAAQNTEHFFSLLRFSDAATGAQPELVRQPITREFQVDFEELKNKLVATQLAVAPLQAIDAIERAIEVQEDENLIVYLVTDLRTEQWQDAAAMRQAIKRLNELGAQVQLVQCVDQTRENLAVSQLRPTPGQQAAGVLIKMEVEVTNFGKQAARNVPIQLEQRVHTNELESDGEIISLGAVKIDVIEPGATARRTFDVTFSTSGYHEVVARLPGDAVAADNERFCVLQVLPEVPVLIVDGGGSDNPIYLQLALSSSSRIKTGLKTIVQSPDYLREQPLDAFHTIYAVNIAQLDEAEIEALDAYVRGGGGLIFFAGDATRRNFVNEYLYREGEGLFPLPLTAPATLLVDRLEKSPDISVDDEHPIFNRTSKGQYNSWLQQILVGRYYAADGGWRAEDEPSVSVIARLRNGDPLMVEKTYGEGRVLAVLTTASPLWNNWALANPTFPVVVLESQIYMGGEKVDNANFDVGSRYAVRIVEEDYQPEAKFTIPAGQQRLTVTSAAKKVTDDESLRVVELEDTASVGTYEVQLTPLAAEPEVRRFAANFVADEGNLKTMAQGDLQNALQDVEYQYREAGEFLAPVQQQAGFAIAEQWWFFLAFAVMMIIEQLLAYSASYHPPLIGGSR